MTRRTLLMKSHKIFCVWCRSPLTQLWCIRCVPKTLMFTVQKVPGTCFIDVCGNRNIVLRWHGYFCETYFLILLVRREGRKENILYAEVTHHAAPFFPAELKLFLICMAWPENISLLSFWQICVWQKLCCNKYRKNRTAENKASYKAQRNLCVKLLKKTKAK